MDFRSYLSCPPRSFLKGRLEQDKEGWMAGSDRKKSQVFCALWMEAGLRHMGELAIGGLVHGDQSTEERSERLPLPRPELSWSLCFYSWSRDRGQGISLRTWPIILKFFLNYTNGHCFPSLYSAGGIFNGHFLSPYSNPVGKIHTSFRCGEGS